MKLLGILAFIAILGTSAANGQTATAPSTMPTTQKIEVVYDTPLAACEAYCRLTLTGERNALADVCVVSSVELQPAWEAMDNVTLAHRRLERAIAARFPKGDVEIADGFTVEIAMNSILARLPKAKIELSTDGKSAKVTYPNEEKPDYPKAEPFYCLKGDKGWKIDAVRTEPVTTETIKLVASFKKEIEGCDKLAAEVDAGHVETLKEAKTRYETMLDATHP